VGVVGLWTGLETTRFAPASPSSHEADTLLDWTVSSPGSTAVPLIEELVLHFSTFSSTLAKNSTAGVAIEQATPPTPSVSNARISTSVKIDCETFAVPWVLPLFSAVALILCGSGVK